MKWGTSWIWWNPHPHLPVKKLKNMEQANISTETSIYSEIVDFIDETMDFIDAII